MSEIAIPTSQNFTFELPTKLIFGCGTASQLPKHLKELNINNPLILTGSTVSKLKQFKEMKQNLQENQINPTIWDEVISDPTEATIQEAAVKYQDCDCDGLLAFGGGSPMDTAKACGILIHHNEDSIIKFVGSEAKPITGATPLICVPTTSGTGSEVTNVSVFTFTPLDRKVFLINKACYPKISVVDPELSYTMPKEVTASTGLDALSHAIGCYTHEAGGTPISDALALYSIELVSKNLRKAVEDGGDVSARVNMSLAATLAGIAFDHGGVHLEHSIGHVLGVKRKVPHGFSCLLLMPEILEFIAPVKADRLAKIGEMLGMDVVGMSTEKAGEVAVLAVLKLMGDVGAPSLSDYGVGVDDIPALSEKCKNEMWSSPRAIDVSDFNQMFKKALSR